MILSLSLSRKILAFPANNAEIHRRLRLGNLLVLTAQGTPFLHSGQEYGRTKQFKDPAYRTPVSDDKVPNKSHLLVDENGKPLTTLTLSMIPMTQVMPSTTLIGKKQPMKPSIQRIRALAPSPKD